MNSGPRCKEVAICCQRLRTVNGQVGNPVVTGYSDAENARIQSDKALGKVMTEMISDDMEFFRHFTDNDDFRRFVSNTVFDLVYQHAPEG